MMNMIFRFRRKKCENKGFSLAEMMMAVAIIGILAGVSFISVASYLRSMALLERDGIAKEIYVAAQNHLTMLESQNYSGFKDEDFINKLEPEPPEPPEPPRNAPPS